MKEEKISIWRRLIISIKDIEKYQELAVDKLYKTIGYLALLILLLTIAMSSTILIKFNGSFQEFEEYVSNVTLENDNLSLLTESKRQSEAQLEVIPNYEIINYIIWPLSIFIVYFLLTLIDGLTLAIMGYFVCLIIRIKLKFKELYNIAICSLTLPIILNIVYIVINLTTGFTIKYFQMMYTIIACIYVISAILIIRSNIIKRNIELTKILQEQERVRLELEQRELEKREQEEKERIRKKDKEAEKKEKKQKKKGLEGEPEGTKA